MRLRLVLAAVLLVLAACGDSPQRARGVVIEVEGGLTEIEGFLLRLPDGSDLRFVPADGILFHGDAPLGHIRDHLRSGEPIEVEFEVLSDGTAVALEVSD